MADNKYRAQPDTSPQPKSTASTSGEKIINVNFEDNLLSDTDNGTYKFSWFVANPDSFNTDDPRLSDRKVVFAESGKSARFFIKSISIDSVIAPTFRLKNTQFNSFNMEVVEPKGFTLMDSILAASQYLGIHNYMFAPYYLQLDFIKYNEEGVPEVLSDSSRLWAIKILNIQTSTTSEGTIYNIDAVEFEQLSNSNHASILDTNYLIECSTVGSFFTKLQESINREKEAQLGIWRKIPDQIRFEVDESIAGLSVKSPEDKRFSPQHQEDTTFWQAFNKINVPKGYSIESIISNLMIANREWVSRYLRKINIKINPYNTKDTDHFHKIWSIDVNVELGEFDPYIGDYARTYVYKINPYFSIFKNPDPLTLSETINNASDQEERLTAINNIFNIRKRYDYIYTGLNTEVLNFDIDMNFLWTSHIPIYRGLTVDNARTDGPQIRPDVLTYRRNTDQLLQDRRRYQAQLRNASTPEEEIDAFISMQSTEDAIDNLRTSAGLASREEAERLSQRIEESRNKVRNTTGTQSAEDIAFERENHFSDTRKLTPVPTTIVIDGNYAGNESTWLSDGTIDNYRSIAASILNNIQSPDLMTATLTIKGDPYWLGLSRTESRLEIPVNTIETNQHDNLFVLRFKLGLPVTEDDDGFSPSKNSDVITGIYSAIEVKHNFVDGSFVQEITGFRDVNTNILLSKDFMNDNNNG